MADSTPILDQIAQAQAQKETTANSLFGAMSGAALFGRHDSACAGRVWAWYGGRWGGTSIANGTQTIGASTTTYMVVARATGAVSFDTVDTDWTDDAAFGRAYKIVTGASAVTSFEDHRDGPGGIFSGGGGTSEPADTVLPPVYLFASHRNSDMRLQLAASGDGKSFQWLAQHPYDPPSDELRDPSLSYEATTGLWWLAYTNPPTGNVYAGSVTHFGVTSSPDLLTWTHVADPAMTAISGVQFVWAPEWFIDDDGSVHVFFCATTNSDHISSFKIYETHPTNAGRTTWSAPVEVTGTSLPASMLDPCVVKIGSTYYLWFKNNASEKLGYCTSTSLTSGYAVVQSGATDWSGLGTTIEAPSLVQVDASTWRLYLDKYTDLGYYYSESTNSFATWSAKTLVGLPTDVAVFNHGTVLKITDEAQQSNILAASLQYPRPSTATGAAVGYQILAIPFGVQVTSTTSATLNNGLGTMIPVQITSPMLLDAMKLYCITTGTAVITWGLFDYTSSPTAAVKLAGGTGTLSATGLRSLSPTGAPVSIAPGSYMLIIAAASTGTQPTVRRTDSNSSSHKLQKFQASYTWTDTPNVTTGWSDDTVVLNATLAGRISASVAW